MTPDPTFAIMAFAAAFAVISLAINHYLGIRKRTKEIQAEMKKFQDEFKKAAEKKDEAAMKRLEPQQEQTMKLMQEMMFLPWKSMIFVLPIFFILIGEPFIFHTHGLLLDWYPQFVIFLPFDLHFDAIFSFNIIKEGAYGPKGFFILSTVLFSLIFSSLEGQVEKMLGNKAKK